MTLIRFGLPLLLLALLFTGCKKGSGDITPATDPVSLLVRQWEFNEVAVQTDAKRYVIPPSESELFGDDAVATFKANGQYTYTEDKITKTGKWEFSKDNKVLTLTDADAQKSPWQVIALTSSVLELGTISVDLTKDQSKYTQEEALTAIIAAFALDSIDKLNGGTVDFDKEPEPKRLQLLVKGRAK